MYRLLLLLLIFAAHPAMTEELSVSVNGKKIILIDPEIDEERETEEPSSEWHKSSEVEDMRVELEHVYRQNT